MKLKKIVMVVSMCIVLIGVSGIGMSCRTNDDTTKTQEENTNVKSDSNGTTNDNKEGQEENTNVKGDNTNNNTNTNADLPEDTKGSNVTDPAGTGNSENNPSNEKTNSNDTEGKGSVTPGKVN